MSSPLVLSIVAPEDHWMFVHTSIEKVVTRPSAWLAVRALLRRCAKTKPLADVTPEDVCSLYVPCRHRGCGLVCQRIRTEMWDMPSDVPVTLSAHWTPDLDLHVTEQAVRTSVPRRSILHQLQRRLQLSPRDTTPATVLFWIQQTLHEDDCGEHCGEREERAAEQPVGSD